MARLVSAAVLAIWATCHGAHVQRQIGTQLNLNSPTPEDHLALLQQKVEPYRRRTRVPAQSTGRFSLLNEVRERQVPSEMELYCSAYPDLCKPPFNCHMVNFTEQEIRIHTEGMAADGKPNWQSWCTDPQYMPYVAKCAAGDLIEAARVQYELTVAGAFGGLTRENDGSYCFLEGHCANAAVTENTTLAEAAQMCDERFGREAWARWGSDRPPEDAIGYGMELIDDPRSGFNSPKQTRPFLLAACAMGNFHCDVVYCRETYCKNDYYVNKYGHLLRQFGWVE